MIGNDGLSDDEIKEILGLRNVAVVGMSRIRIKPAHYVPRYLKENGYNIIPVNPAALEILGLNSYKSLLDVAANIDIVEVFRPSTDVPPIVEAAIMKAARVVWMQEGIYSKESVQAAKKNDIKVVWNRCMMHEHKRLIGK